MGIHIPPSMNLGDWMLHWLSCGNVFASQLFCSSLWKVWDARNKLIFEDLMFIPAIIANNATKLISEFNEANRKPVPHSDPIPGAANWVPPPNSWVKLNVDAGCFNDGTTGWGLVIRDHTGAVSLTACKSEEVELSPMVAEAIGLRWCLSVAKDLSLNKVVVESDAATGVDCVNGKAIMAAIDPIIQDCCSILNLFEDIKVTAICRNQNSIAHELVQLSKVVGSKNWVGTVPRQIYHLLCTDSVSGFI